MSVVKKTSGCKFPFFFFRKSFSLRHVLQAQNHNISVLQAVGDTQDVFSLTEQSRPVQRRSEEVIISGHVAALVRCQHLHHGLVTISHSKVQGGPTLVVLPVQQGLGGSCLLDAHNTADTVRRMKKRKEDKLCCVCVFVPEYSGRFVWRWALDCVQPSAAGSCPHCLGCQCWNRA